MDEGLGASTYSHSELVVSGEEPFEGASHLLRFFLAAMDRSSSPTLMGLGVLPAFFPIMMVLLYVIHLACCARPPLWATLVNAARASMSLLEALLRTERSSPRCSGRSPEGPNDLRAPKDMPFRGLTTRSPAPSS